MTTDNPSKTETPSSAAPASRTLQEELCKNCLKPTSVCPCESLKTVTPRLKVLILQHPQEPDKLLGTARLTEIILGENQCRLQSGLSWRNLAHAWGSEVSDPKRWGVLYLGSGMTGTAGPIEKKRALNWVNKAGIRLMDGEQAQIDHDLEGIILIDGTWSQAKTLWWRNAWLLKVRRGILNVPKASLYGNLRKEPRRECLSTLESAAFTLEALGENHAVRDALLEGLQGLLDRVKIAYPSGKLAGTKTGARRFQRRRRK